MCASSRAANSRLGGDQEKFCLLFISIIFIYLFIYFTASRDVREVGRKSQSGSRGQPNCEKQKHLGDQVSVTACN